MRVKMNFLPAEIEGIIARTYHLEGEAKPLPGEVDLNFLFTAQDHRKYLFKVAKEGTERAHLEFQNAMMRH